MSVVGIELGIAVAMLAGMVLALEVGFRLGRCAHRTDPGGGGSQVGAIQGAVLGLLGLLLAFSFAAAGSRFLERQDLIIREANAIGTSYLRADLLAEPHRSNLRTALAEYTQHRIAASVGTHIGWDDAVLSEIEHFHGRIWSAARDGIAGHPELAVVVLTPVNEVIDLHATRVGAARKHVPWLVMLLLVACSLLSVAVIGYGCGLDDRRRLPLTLSLALLVAAALCITIDLDYPRAGLLRLSDRPLEDLKFETH